VSKRPVARGDVRSLTGYHSPQVAANIRLNTNESPLPPPSEFLSELADLVRDLELHRYPDRGAMKLRMALSSYHGFEPGQILCANGSNEVLQILLLTFGGPGKSAGLFQPTYAMHRQIALATGTAVSVAPRGTDFTLSPEIVRAFLEEEEPEVLFLCSPNNPTGAVDSPETIEAAVDAVEAYGGLVVLDEAYADFDGCSNLGLLKENRSLVIVKTFSKLWSMAGLRLGYLLGPSWCVRQLEDLLLPYHLDSLKQAGGIIALRHSETMEARARNLVSERERIVKALDELPVRVWPSRANFVLFRPDRLSGGGVWQALLDRSVLIRDCSSWDGLKECLRVTVGTEEENNKFLAALREVLL